jgi:hypothetical protein
MPGAPGLSQPTSSSASWPSAGRPRRVRPCLGTRGRPRAVPETMIERIHASRAAGKTLS